jgi:hypothetical protein
MPWKMIHSVILAFAIFVAAHGQETMSSFKDIPVSTHKFFYSRKDAIEAGISDLAKIQFWRALKNTTTAPNFVLVTVTTTANEVPSTICVLAPDFLRAIEIENNLDQKGSFEFAMKSFGQAFSFRKQESNQLVATGYSRADLELAISLVSKFSNADLISRFSNESPKLEFSFLSNFPSTSGSYLNYQAAIAHAISLRGLLVGRGCLGPNLGVEE